MIDVRHIAAAPEEVGIDSERLEAVFARAKRDVDEGVLPTAQVAVARRGKLAGVRTFGSAVQGGLDRAATDATLYCIYSATKAVIGVAVWKLLEDELVRLDERVAEIVPEFGTNGKGDVTVEQVMLHGGGFPTPPNPESNWGDRSALLQAFGRWELSWEPGSKFEYHPSSAHWVLAEIITRRAGVDYREFVRDQITGPIGVQELFVGMPAEVNGRVADVRYMGTPEPPPSGWGEVTPEWILTFNQLHVREIGVPGAGGITGAAELALFYQPLINGGQTADGTRILQPETIELATAIRTSDRHIDSMTGAPANRALAVVVAGDDGQANLRGFGRSASGRTFGHPGAGGQIGWGDPESGISVGYCTNGFVDEVTLGRRTTAISSLAAGCGI